jgi:hypothetical protein
MASRLCSKLKKVHVRSQEIAMQTIEPTLWQLLSPEQQARIIAILVQILLRHLVAPAEVAHDPA